MGEEQGEEEEKEEKDDEEEEEDDDDDEEEGGGGGGGAARVFSAWLPQGEVADLKPHQRASEALKQVAPGCTLSAAVLGSRWLEGLVEVTARKSALAETTLSYAALSAGEVVKGSIARIDERGARVRLGRGVYGTCAASDLTDKPLKAPHTKFSKGQSVRCLVLECEPAREKLLLCLKPAMVSSELPRVSRLADASPGVVTHGVISSIRAKSVLLRLVGGVSGIVRGSEMSARFGALWEDDPSSCYREGQVVRTTVLGCEPAKKQLILSLLTPEEAASLPASNLLGRRASASKPEAKPEGKADGKKAKRKRAELEEENTADEEEAAAAHGAARLRAGDEATPGTHALASALSIADGQIFCRLDRKGEVRGRLHVSEMAAPGQDVPFPEQLPTEPFHAVVLGTREPTEEGAEPTFELSVRPAEVYPAPTFGRRPLLDGGPFGEVDCGRRPLFRWRRPPQKRRRRRASVCTTSRLAVATPVGCARSGRMGCGSA